MSAVATSDDERSAEPDLGSGPVLTEPAFVFHQLPGCGSRELVEFAYTNFAVVHDEADALGGVPGETLDLVDPRWLSAAKLFLFRSHFRYGTVFIDQLYPEFFADRRFRVFLFVDDPLRLAAVTYLHLTRRGGDDVPSTFAEFLKQRKNSLAFQLGATEENYRTLLDRYFFVGVNSRKAESLDKLYRAMASVLDAAESTPNVRRSRNQLRQWTAKAQDTSREVEVEKLMASVGWLDRVWFGLRNRLDVRIAEEAKRRLAAA